MLPRKLAFLLQSLVILNLKCSLSEHLQENKAFVDDYLYEENEGILNTVPILRRPSHCNIPHEEIQNFIIFLDTFKTNGTLNFNEPTTNKNQAPADHCMQAWYDLKSIFQQILRQMNHSNSSSMLKIGNELKEDIKIMQKEFDESMRMTKQDHEKISEKLNQKLLHRITELKELQSKLLSEKQFREETNIRLIALHIKHNEIKKAAEELYKSDVNSVENLVVKIFNFSISVGSENIDKLIMLERDYVTSTYQRALALQTLYIEMERKSLLESLQGLRLASRVAELEKTLSNGQLNKQNIDRENASMLYKSKFAVLIKDVLMKRVRSFIPLFARQIRNGEMSTINLLIEDFLYLKNIDLLSSLFSNAYSAYNIQSTKNILSFIDRICELEDRHEIYYGMDIMALETIFKEKKNKYRSLGQEWFMLGYALKGITKNKSNYRIPDQDCFLGGYELERSLKPYKLRYCNLKYQLPSIIRKICFGDVKIESSYYRKYFLVMGSDGMNDDTFLGYRYNGARGYLGDRWNFDPVNDAESFLIKSHEGNLCVNVKEYYLSEDVLFVRLNNCTEISTKWKVNFESEDEVSIYTSKNHYMYTSAENFVRTIVYIPYTTYWHVKVWKTNSASQDWLRWKIND